MWNPEIGDRAVIGGRLAWDKVPDARYGDRDKLNGTVVRIVRETPTQWLDDQGNRWRKNDNGGVGKISGHLLQPLATLLNKDWSEFSAYVQGEFDLFRYRGAETYMARVTGVRDACNLFLAKAAEIMKDG